MNFNDKWKDQETHERSVFSTVESASVSDQRPLTTLVASSIIAPDDLASLAKYFTNDGERLNGPGSVIRMACETFVELVRHKYPETRFKDSSQAFRFLQANNLIGSRNNDKRVARFLSFNGLLEENKPISSVSSEIEQAREAIKFMIRDGQSIDPEAFELAQMTVVNGKPMENERLDSYQNSLEVSRSTVNTETFRNENKPDDGVPLNLPRSADSLIEPLLERSLIILKKDGTSRIVKRDQSIKGRKEVYIFCRVCKSHSTVLLDFEPDTEFVDSDTCPKCVGITSHQVAENMVNGIQIIPMNLSKDEFDKNMLAGPTNDQLTEGE